MADKAAKTDLAKTDLAKTDLAKTDLAKTDLAKTGLAKTGFVKTSLPSGTSQGASLQSATLPLDTAQNASLQDTTDQDAADQDAAAENLALSEVGRLMFAREWDFTWATAKLGELPPMEGLEIAFAGRSNVGKSSLINALTGRKALARTSNTPGRTQQLNFFKADGPLSIVDMPGYGFAAVGKEKVANWTQLIHDYLRGRSNLARVYLLIDGRHGIKDTDKPVLDQLDLTAVSYQVVLTKADDMKQADHAATLARVKAIILKRPAAHPDVIFTSSETGMGIAQLRTAIAALLAERKVL